MQNTTMEKTEANGLLQTGLIPGSKGGLSNGIGMEIRWDGRNNLYSPTKGYYARVSGLAFDKFMGSDFQWNHMLFDLRKYFNVGKKQTFPTQS